MQNISNIKGSPFGYTVKKPTSTELAQPDGGVRTMQKIQENMPATNLEKGLKAGGNVQKPDNAAVAMNLSGSAEMYTETIKSSSALPNKTPSNYTNKSTAVSETSGLHFDMRI